MKFKLNSRKLKASLYGPYYMKSYVGDHSKGKSFQNKYACHLSLSIVALGAIGFVLEVFNMLEYIKGMNQIV